MSAVKLIIVAGLGYFAYIKWQESKDLARTKQINGTGPGPSVDPDRRPVSTIDPYFDPTFDDPRYKVQNPTQVQNPYQGFAVGEPTPGVKMPGLRDMQYLM